MIGGILVQSETAGLPYKASSRLYKRNWETRVMFCTRLPTWSDVPPSLLKRDPDYHPTQCLFAYDPKCPPHNGILSTSLHTQL